MGRQSVLLPKNRHTDAQITDLAEAAALPLTGLEQRTDRHEPLDARLMGSTAAAFLATNAVGLFHFRLGRDFPVAKLGIALGATVAGSVDLGIYTSADLATFTRVARTGVTAVGTLNTVQEIALSAPYTCLAGVDYWFALGVSDGTLETVRISHRAGIGLTQVTSIYKSSAYSSGLPTSISSVTGGVGGTPWFVLIA